MHRARQANAFLAASYLVVAAVVWAFALILRSQKGAFLTGAHHGRRLQSVFIDEPLGGSVVGEGARHVGVNAEMEKRSADPTHAPPSSQEPFYTLAVASRSSRPTPVRKSEIGWRLWSPSSLVGSTATRPFNPLYLHCCLGRLGKQRTESHPIKQCRSCSSSLASLRERRDLYEIKSTQYQIDLHLLMLTLQKAEKNCYNKV